MSEDAQSPKEVSRTDEVTETWRYRPMGVKVEKVVRSGYEDDQELLKVYHKKRQTFGDLETGEPKTRSRWVKVGECPVGVSVEILHGLAEAHGYNLEPK